MSTAYLGLGSNVDAERHIRIAIDALRAQFGKITISPVYRNKAIGFDGEDFLNLAVKVETAMSPLQLRRFLRDLESANGRDRSAPKWSDRTLDIDILLFDDLVTDDELLEIPRKEISKFAHVLKPLRDIAGEVQHPVAGETISAMRYKLDLDERALNPVAANFLD